MKYLTVLFLFLSVSGVTFGQLLSSPIDAAYQLTQTKTPLPQLDEYTRRNVPLQQLIVFQQIPSDKAFPMNPPFFRLYSEMQTDAGNCREIYFAGIDQHFLESQPIQPFYIGKDTVFQFIIRSRTDVEDFNRFRFHSCKLENILDWVENASFFSECIYVGKDSVEVEKDKQALLILSKAYTKSDNFSHDSPSTEDRLLYLLNRTVGTQDHHRRDLSPVSWHTWKLENDSLIAEIFYVRSETSYKCAFHSKTIRIPLKGIRTFSETEDGMVAIDFKENHAAVIGRKNALKGTCAVNPWRDSELSSTTTAQITLATNWLGHIGMNIDDLNKWIQNYQQP